MPIKKASARKKRTQSRAPSKAQGRSAIETTIPAVRSSAPRAFTVRPAEEAVLHLFRIHPSRPATEQVRNTILDLLRHGYFREGDRLPSASAIAAQLGVNPAVAVQAYADLIKMRVVRGRERVGYFVADSQSIWDALAGVDMSRAIFACRQLGMPLDEIERTFYTALEEHKRFIARERMQRGPYEHDDGDERKT